MGNIPYAGIYNQLVDIFMLSSDFEGLPYCNFRSNGLWKANCSVKSWGINEIVIDGKNGYVVNNIPDIF